MKKNLLFLFLTLFSFSAIHAAKDGNIEWNRSNDGTLTISGKGNMPDYGEGTAPWYSIRDGIKVIDLADTITKVGNYAFYNLVNLREIRLNSNLK